MGECRLQQVEEEKERKWTQRTQTKSSRSLVVREEKRGGGGEWALEEDLVSGSFS